MTFIINEFRYVPGATTASSIVCAADQRITDLATGRPAGSRRKIFTINGLSATISYFGLADYDAGKTFEDYFKAVEISNTEPTVEAFANRLLLQMNAIVNKGSLRANPSGFHIAGFSPRGVPQMWYMSNIGGIAADLSYTKLRTYYELEEQLSLPHHCGKLYDPTTGDYTEPFEYHFANGDLRAFGAAWSALSLFEALTVSSGLAKRGKGATLGDRLCWKMQALSAYYRFMAASATVGKPIDIFTINPTGVISKSPCR